MLESPHTCSICWYTDHPSANGIVWISPMRTSSSFRVVLGSTVGPGVAVAVEHDVVADQVRPDLELLELGRRRLETDAGRQLAEQQILMRELRERVAVAEAGGDDLGFVLGVEVVAVLRAPGTEEA